MFCSPHKHQPHYSKFLVIKSITNIPDQIQIENSEPKFSSGETQKVKDPFRFAFRRTSSHSVADCIQCIAVDAIDLVYFTIQRCCTHTSNMAADENVYQLEQTEQCVAAANRCRAVAERCRALQNICCSAQMCMCVCVHAQLVWMRSCSASVAFCSLWLMS